MSGFRGQPCESNTVTPKGRRQIPLVYWLSDNFIKFMKPGGAGGSRATGFHRLSPYDDLSPPAGQATQCATLHELGLR